MAAARRTELERRQGTCEASQLGQQAGRIGCTIVSGTFYAAVYVPAVHWWYVQPRGSSGPAGSCNTFSEPLK